MDHLPEQFSLDGIHFGQRWVCSPFCVEARVAVSPFLAACHYMTLYLLRDETVLPGFAALARRLHEEDRFFEARRPHLSGPFTVTGRWAAPRIRVSPEAVPFRPSVGIYVVVGPPVDGAALVHLDGVAGAWSFKELPLHQDEPGARDHPEEPVSAERHITVAFIDSDLMVAASEIGRWLGGGAHGVEW